MSVSAVSVVLTHYNSILAAVTKTKVISDLHVHDPRPKASGPQFVAAIAHMSLVVRSHSIQDLGR